MNITAPTDALRLFAFHLAGEMLSEEQAGDLFLTTEETENTFVAHVEFGNTHLTDSAEKAIHRTARRTENVACGKVLYRLFRALSDASLPYGTLVGVRPVKIALFYLSRGADAESVRRILTDEYLMQEKHAKLLVDLAVLEQASERALCKTDAMLYLSIPFCPSRCRYCSFVSHSAPSQLSLIPDYLLRMKEELLETAALFHETGKTLRAVYLGGGTPGLLTANQLTELFTDIKREFPLADKVEYTAELGRPDTITREKCEALADLGIGRICINPQTLSDFVLAENSRHHTAEDFYRAYAIAKDAKIPTVNTDLIAGLSGDTPTVFSQTVASILALAPENLTIHALCKKRASSEENMPENDSEHLWFDAMQNAQENCINAGYHPNYLYRQKNTIANLENLGFAKNGQDCLYNIAMMEDLCDVFAVGAGAMTKLKKTTEDGYQMIRLPAYKYPAEFLSDPEKGRKNRQDAKKLCTENYV